MINIVNKEDCTGCSACVQCCPKSCITMRADSQGFTYPVVDHERCIDCHMCERVCPVINHDNERHPKDVYATHNYDHTVVMHSSSGGVFYRLCAGVIGRGGVVFGARFDDNLRLVHAIARTMEEARAFCGSKYLQSEMGDTMSAVRGELEAGRQVLFSGTPCQVAGLRRYLRRDYGTQLLTVDFVCHGVPSPLVFDKYLHTIIPDTSRVGTISFRDKRQGWELFGMSIKDKCGDELYYRNKDHDPFLRLFLRNYTIRPSCFACPVKTGRSGADITLADFWKIKDIQPADYDRDGVSLVLAYTDAGADALQDTGLRLSPTMYETALSCNHAIEESTPQQPLRAQFWQRFEAEGAACMQPIVDSFRPPLWRRIINRAMKTAGIKMD